MDALIQRLRQVLEYNPDGGGLVWKMQLAPRGAAGTEAGCTSEAYTSKKSRVSIRVDGKIYLAHRLAWMIHYGEIPNGQIDHIDGNPQNNAISNLRLVSNAQNGRNRGKTSRNVSGWKGVSWNKERNKWVAQIGHMGKSLNLGRYDDKREAAEAYIFAAIELHGEYARFE